MRRLFYFDCKYAAKVRKKIMHFCITRGSKTHTEKAFQRAFLIRVLPKGFRFSACLKIRFRNLFSTKSNRTFIAVQAFKNPVCDKVGAFVVTFR